MIGDISTTAFCANGNMPLRGDFTADGADGTDEACGGR
jgi:hypothetical protein